MAEEEARAALAAFDGLGGLERWIAEQRPWQAIPAGYSAAANNSKPAGTVTGFPPSITSRGTSTLRSTVSGV